MTNLPRISGPYGERTEDCGSIHDGPDCPYCGGTNQAPSGGGAEK